MTTLLVLVLIFAAVAVLGPRFGVDSHESREWQYDEFRDLTPRHL